MLQQQRLNSKGEKYVIGPTGAPLTIADLPPPNTQRWVIRRKAEVVAAVERARAKGRSASGGLYLRRALAQFLRDTDRDAPALTVVDPE